MKTLIAFATKSGTSEKCASMIAEHFDSPDIVDLSKNSNPDVRDYDLIIAGGSVRMGNLHAHLIRFMKVNLRKLEDKQMAFFVCCMNKGEKFDQQVEKGFPKAIRENAIEIAHLGALLKWDKMNLLERSIMKKIVESEKLEEPKIDATAVEEFVSKVKSTVGL